MHSKIHIYNQRVTSAQNRILKGIPLTHINTNENNPGLFGTLPIPTKKLPFRLDEIPYYDTNFMCYPVNSLARQAGVNQIPTVDDEESWDAPFQKSTSLNTHLMSYNAFRKEQGCQTNWNCSHEHDDVYHQIFCRDPNKMSRYILYIVNEYCYFFGILDHTIKMEVIIIISQTLSI